MMIAVAALAFGARAVTVEWGLNLWVVQPINEMFGLDGQYDGTDYYTSVDTGLHWAGISEVYLYVYAYEGAYGSSGWLDMLIHLDDQLYNTKTFDGTDPSIVDGRMWSSPLTQFWDDVENPHYPEETIPVMASSPPTYFSDIPDGMNFQALLLLKLKEPSAQGDTFIYAFLVPWYDEWWWDDNNELQPPEYYKDGVPYFMWGGDWAFSPTDATLLYPIPEPATGLLALAGVALLIRRKRK